MSEPNMHGSSDDWNKLKHLVDLSAENARLQAEVERLTKDLADEKSANANVEGRQNSANRGLSMENARLKAEVERLKQEKNELAVMIHPVALKAWMNLNAANREQGCLVNPIKVAQYLPKPPTKEGKQP